MAARLGAGTASALQRNVLATGAAQRAAEQQAALNLWSQLSQQALEAERKRRFEVEYEQPFEKEIKKMELKAGVGKSIFEKTADMISGLLGSAITSDKTKKEKIRNAEQDAYDFLEALNPSSYHYKRSAYNDVVKPPVAPDKRVYGIMAQDALKSAMGKTFVRQTPDGLALDIPTGFGALLASQAALHRRVKELEGKKGGKDG
jgi:hypothetical protein